MLSITLESLLQKKVCRKKVTDRELPRELQGRRAHNIIIKDRGVP
jgi:hypothetical protein